MPGIDPLQTMQATAAYQEKVTEHADQKELAERLFASDPDAIGEIIKTSGAFDALSCIGSQLHFAVAGPLRVSATIEVHGQQIIPRTRWLCSERQGERQSHAQRRLLPALSRNE